MDYQKEYHFYIDEGGIFGQHCIILITQNKISSKNSMTEYYFGKLLPRNIARYLYFFSIVFPECTIINIEGSLLKDSEIKSFIEPKGM